MDGLGGGIINFGTGAIDPGTGDIDAVDAREYTAGDMVLSAHTLIYMYTIRRYGCTSLSTYICTYIRPTT